MIGTLSYHLIGVLQEKQWDPGEATDSSMGMR